jgi:hypothetical protein
MTTAAFVLSRSELELLPSDEDVCFYQEHGWYLSKKLLSDDELKTLLAES